MEQTAVHKPSVNLVTEVPGPRSVEIMRRKDAAVAAAMSIHMPIAAASAEGALLTDVDGNTFIDFSGGVGCLNVGHSNPRVLEAIERQVRQFTHTDFTVVMYEVYVDLAEKINATAPIQGPVKSAFFNSGAEAVENAVKIARTATGRQAVIAFEGAFHGRTLMAMSLTSKTHPYKAGFGPFAPEVYRAPFPYPFRCELDHEHGEACAEQPLQKLRDMFSTSVAPESVAAIIVEPIQGEGGFLVPPRTFLHGLRDICTEHGIVLIADEVQTGMGRTGTMWACEHFGLEPDLLLSAKSIASGLPLSAVVGKAQIMDAVGDSAIGGTYVGNPVACAAALAVIDELQGGLLEHGQRVGQRLRERFEEWAGDDAGIGEVRGVGPMIAMELVGDGKRPDVDRANAIVKEAAQNGLILLKAGIYGNCIRVLVPLSITDEQLDEALEIFETAVRASA